MFPWTKLLCPMSMDDSLSTFEETNVTECSWAQFLG